MLIHVYLFGFCFVGGLVDKLKLKINTMPTSKKKPKINTNSFLNVAKDLKKDAANLSTYNCSCLTILVRALEKEGKRYSNPKW